MASSLYFSGVPGSSGSNITYQLPTDPTNSNLNGLRYDPASTTTPTIDRILWFTSLANVADIPTAAVGLPPAIPPAERAAHVFGDVDPAGATAIQGGQYLVVGSRQTTYFGSQLNSGPTHTNLPNDHRIVLENVASTSGTLPAPAVSWANVYTGANERVAKRAISMRDSVSMVAVTNAPWTSGGTTRLSPTVGISVSEPIPTPGSYYATPTQLVNSSNTTAAPNGAPGFGAAGEFKDGYHDYSATPPAGQTPLPDTPFDADPATPIGLHYAPTHPPVGSSGVAAPGTQLDWCTAYLQRLADPERPWHAVLNPYITVDWMPIDLTVFSGEETISGGTYQFGSRQKNGATTASARGSTFLSYSNDAPVATTAITGSTSYFTHELAIDNATNVLASRPQVQRPTTNASAATSNFVTLGYLNSPYLLLNESPGNSASVAPNYVGSPSTAPLNLTWFNRPFTSAYELMLVPLCSPGQLMQEFNPPPTSGTFATGNQYAANSLNLFTHLPNFFQPRDATNNFAASTMFELMTTPSPWSDADSLIPPSELASVTPAPANARTFEVLRPFVPPYNRVSNMVERGRLNINTVSEESAWQGVEWNYMIPSGRAAIGSTSYWANLLQSRRIYTPTGGHVGGNSHLHPGYPTEFPGVFKSQFSVGMVPNTRAPIALDAGGVLSAATLFRKSLTSNAPMFSIRSDLGALHLQQEQGTKPMPLTSICQSLALRI